jgi:spore maturation protein CgeB
MDRTGLEESTTSKANGPTKELRVFVVAPGSTSSTYDVFKYTLSSMRRRLSDGVVTGVYMHSLLEYHRAAISVINPEMENGVAWDFAINRSISDLLSSIILHRPDVVHIIDGVLLSSGFYEALYRHRRELKLKFVVSIHLTEEPYMNEYTSVICKYADVIFVNDKLSVSKFDPGSSKHVYYVPHSYSPEVHHISESEDKPIDVFFCGTFYPERLKFFGEVDWSGINVKMYGNAIGDIPDSLTDIIELGSLDNADVADFYRKSKISLNYHRKMRYMDHDDEVDESEVYSLNPRSIEAAACGAFQLTDYRAEVVDMFGDTVPVYGTPQELGEMIRYYLDNELERKDLAIRSSQLVLPYSCDARSAFMLDKIKLALSCVTAQRIGV